MRLYRSRARGYSLIELMVVVALLAVALTAITESLISSENTIELAAVQTSLEAKAHDVLERITRDAKDGILNSFPTPPPPSITTLTFKKATGWDPTQPKPTLVGQVDARLLPTAQVSYVLVSDPPQMLNGQMTTVTHLDYTDVNGATQTITNQLKPATAVPVYPGGFFYSLNGNQLSVTVELQQKYRRTSSTSGTDAEGYLTYTATVSTVVTIRN